VRLLPRFCSASNRSTNGSDFAEAIRDRQLRLRCPCRDASSLDAFFLLRQRHRLSDQAEPDFQIRNLAEMQEAAKQSTETIATLLEAVAAISLIVGGIGIANVMLVSVTERTREIGIRMAVGGRGRDILFQFLTEVVVLATVGGVIGLTRRYRRLEMDGGAGKLAHPALATRDARNHARRGPGGSRGGVLPGAARILAGFDRSASVRVRRAGGRPPGGRRNRCRALA